MKNFTHLAFIKKIQDTLNKLHKKKLERKLKTHTRHHKLGGYLSKAGVNVDSKLISKVLFKLAIGLNLSLTVYLIVFFTTQKGYSLSYILFILFIIWILVFVLLLVLIWLSFLLVLDLRMFRRKLSIEEVLPDFLHLTATNIRSGMTIDRALWFAVRPRFGVLAKEIEIVAKEVMGGAELEDALQKFADKYPSNTLKRSINLLIAGIRSGGEIGVLLTKIASNIQESKLIQKEMAANVTAYAIFISFASIVAGPGLLALSKQLIVIMGGIMSNLSMPSGGSTMFTITSMGISPSDFNIFAIVSLVITSFFSAIIVATIKKGNVKEGVKYIPAFIITSIVIYIVASKILGSVLSGII